MMNAKILLIEDDREVLRSLERLLRQNGYDVTPVDGGLKAIEEAKKNFFNLVITDVRMPGINGIETIEGIRAIQDKTPGSKSEFMVITGYVEDDAPKESVRLGITEFMVKPFDANAFLQAVNERLRGIKENTKQESKGAEVAPLKLPGGYAVCEKKILLKDTNIMGNTYFANYVAWQGEARETLLLSHPRFAQESAKYRHVQMVTHSLYHRFIQESTFGDTIEIKVTTREIKRCSFVMVFRYFNKNTGAFLGEGWQRIAFVDQKIGTFCPIPAYIKELVLAGCEDSTGSDQNPGCAASPAGKQVPGNIATR